MAGVDVAELVVLVVRDLDAVLVVRHDVLEPGIFAINYFSLFFRENKKYTFPIYFLNPPPVSVDVVADQGHVCVATADLFLGDLLELSHHLALGQLGLQERADLVLKIKDFFKDFKKKLK